ncbi:MAG TPA: 6-carboxytetrahydropterin synthase [Chitinophagaceae bacterium]|nr:6-carboxytetrahydropterin synthase [Chitinophagaceae bacterium]
MLQLTKIFHFEMAHAIHGYSGACRKIHGHSYELHVTVSGSDTDNEYIPAPGYIFDFGKLKKLVISSVIETFDHKLLLSRSFLAKNPGLHSQENLVIWEAEPTAENLLIYICNTLKKKLPKDLLLASLKLYETKDSYAEWINRKI